MLLIGANFSPLSEQISLFGSGSAREAKLYALISRLKEGDGRLPVPLLLPGKHPHTQFTPPPFCFVFFCPGHRVDNLHAAWLEFNQNHTDGFITFPL